MKQEKKSEKKHSKRYLPIFYSPKAKLNVIEKDFEALYARVTRKKIFMKKISEDSKKNFYTVVKPNTLDSVHAEALKKYQKNPKKIQKSCTLESTVIIPEEMDGDETAIKCSFRIYQPIKNKILKKSKSSEVDDEVFFINQEPKDNKNGKYRQENILEVEKLKTYRSYFVQENEPRIMRSGNWCASKQRSIPKMKICGSSRFDFKAKSDSEISLESRSCTILEVSDSSLDDMEDEILEITRKKSQSKEGNIFQRQETKIKAINNLIGDKMSRQKRSRFKISKMNASNNIEEIFKARRGSLFKGIMRQKSTRFEIDSELERPNFRKLEKFLKENYINKDWVFRNNFWKAVFANPTARLFTCFGVEKTSYDVAGNGLNLFFSFIKTSLVFLIIFAVVTLPLQMTNYLLYGQSRNPNLKPYVQERITGSVNSLITSTTMAASASFNQVIYEFDLEKRQKNHLSCEFGIITVNPDWTKFGFVPQKKSLNQLSFTIDDSCTDYSNVMRSMEPCIGKNYCQISYSEGWIRTNTNECKDLYDGFKGVMAVYCKHVQVKVGMFEENSIIKIYLTNIFFIVLVLVGFFYYVRL